MKNFKVVLHSLLVDDPTIEKNILSSIGADVVYIPNENQEEFFKSIIDANAIIIADRKITPDAIHSLKECKIIARQGIGFDNIDLETSKKRNIFVTNVPDYCVNEVSDFAMALMFSLIRNIPTYNNHVRSGIWNINSIFSSSQMPPMRRLSTQTLGILGFGKIARQVARKSKAFGFNILVCDPYIDSSVESEYDIKLVNLDTLLKESDIISIHSPLTKETKHMFNKDAFEKMKDTAFIVNTSRGPLVHEEDLYHALKNKIIGGAALDVTEIEPIDKNNPLLTLDNIIITPHAAFFTKDSYEELRIRACEEVKRVLSGKEPLHRVNL